MSKRGGPSIVPDFQGDGSDYTMIFGDRKSKNDLSDQSDHKRNQRPANDPRRIKSTPNFLNLKKTADNEARLKGGACTNNEDIQKSEYSNLSSCLKLNSISIRSAKPIYEGRLGNHFRIGNKNPRKVLNRKDEELSSTNHSKNSHFSTDLDFQNLKDDPEIEITQLFDNQIGMKNGNLPRTKDDSSTERIRNSRHKKSHSCWSILNFEQCIKEPSIK
ncbi:hypothetical protein KP509_31G033400 [Ceratopteris richardii]|uniref:Uncharacterized protein n=1 Tax=Ceratopteris richardii TaxID=49495 RepID=A0A8T2QY91_CERRI|nr:hypothetical protein KP509_31G033400 [Ceratopteris richardii]